MMMYNHKLWKTMSLPLPLNQMVVMYFLYNNKTATISEVANHLAISKQQMSPIIDKLVKKGFIEKKCMSKDRRFSQIYLSEAGIEFIEEHRKTQQTTFINHVTDLSDSDALTFDESVKTVKLMIAKMFDKQKK